MRTLTIKTLLVLGSILSSIVPNLAHADHLTTRPGEERKIFHAKYDPRLYQPTRIETGWGASLRAGGSFYHGDVIAAVSPDPAILVNGQVFTTSTATGTWE